MSEKEAVQRVTVYLPVREVRVGHFSRYESDYFDVKPVLISRDSCGRRGKAANRYFYTAHFVTPNGALPYLHVGGLSSAGINRKANPNWKPPRDGWQDDVLDLRQSQQDAE
ncbi:hypothetical protein [Microbulbifer sp. TYP-18]|uniref:hypothetical protein n=1 Tax=Microbulbifer sp. TYP-18 TaxID=3230024 RepID=UPI0034C5D7E5